MFWPVTFIANCCDWSDRAAIVRLSKRPGMVSLPFGIHGAGAVGGRGRVVTAVAGILALRFQRQPHYVEQRRPERAAAVEGLARGAHFLADGFAIGGREVHGKGGETPDRELEAAFRPQQGAEIGGGERRGNLVERLAQPGRGGCDVAALIGHLSRSSMMASASAPASLPTLPAFSFSRILSTSSVRMLGVSIAAFR